MSIKVSVIVPVFNVEKYLPQCLDSLVNQTLAEIEILVVNDGSTDLSQSIIDDYANRYPDKIRAFTKTNGGLSDARNFGVRHAQGEYIAFVDSDDFVDVDMYEQLYRKGIETNADIVCCPITYEYPSKTLKCFFNTKTSPFGTSVDVSPYILRQTISYAVNRLLKRSFWVHKKYQFPKGQFYEDSALMYTVMLDASLIECVNIPFYHYLREREDAITRTFDKRIFDIFKSCDKMIESSKAKWADNENLYNVIVNLCVRHIFARVKDMNRCEDYSLLFDYLKHAWAYLNKNLPGWQKIYNSAEKKQRALLLHPVIASAYYRLPKTWRSRPRKLPVYGKRIINYTKKKAPRSATTNINEKKRAAIQSFGLELIEFVQTYLKKIDICSFADFGTMLGLVREGKLLAHDLDVDIGVILNTPFDIHRVHVAMERIGFKLWRTYFHGEQIVEESYQMGDLKVDLNFYQINESSAKTWIFYAKPGYQYEKKNHRHIVEMTYSPIREMQTLTVGQCSIVIPKNAEQLLMEKYGESWKVPDTGWIYWQSPVATPIDGIGYFTVCNYRNYAYESCAWKEFSNSIANRNG